MHLRYVFYLCTFLLVACQGQQSQPAQYDSGAIAAKQEAAYATEDQAGEQSDQLPTASQIVRSGSLNAEVKDIDKGRAYVAEIVEKLGARTSGERLENSDYYTSYYVRIRIKAEDFDRLLTELSSIDGTITNSSVDARDVTEEYIDLETRLENKRQYLEQYRTLLKRSNSTEDILKISTAMRQLEEEIESAEGRLRYLSDQVAQSTLEVYLTQRKDFVYRENRTLNFIERLRDSLADGWFGFMQFLLFMARLWPFILIIVALLFLYRRYRRKKRARNT